MNKVKSLFCLISFLCVLGCFPAARAGETAEILVEPSISKPINPMVFGHNALGFRYLFSASKKPRDYSIYGAGQWDVSAGRPDKALLGFARDVNMSVLRFPGGGGSHKYKWKETIGPLHKRPLFKFGLDEYMRLCKATGAVPMMTISYFSNTDQDISDLIMYLNADYMGKNQPGGSAWAEARARNGRPEPYGVKYFELGNEVYWPRRPWKGRVSAREYSNRYLKIRSALKEIDKNIQLGAILHDSEWNHKVTTALKGAMDFGIVHMYPCDYHSDKGELTPNELFTIALAGPNQYDGRLVDIGEKLKRASGRTIPLAITEYNGGFRQEKPAPYRHSLGNALVVADVIRIFLTTEAPILCANYWHFANSYWGALYNPHYRKGKGRYYFRPNYLVFKMYARHFGDALAKTTVSCRGYTSRAYNDIEKTEKVARVMAAGEAGEAGAFSRAIHTRDWGVKKKSRVHVHETSGEISLSFDHYPERAYFDTKTHSPVKPGRSYRLTASINAAALSPWAKAYLEVQDLRGWSKTRWAKQTKSVSGGTGWERVSVNFTPPDDYSKGVKIIIRCLSKEKTPFSGVIRVKDVVLRDLGRKRKYPPTPYLSAISSVDAKGDKLYIMVINKNLRERTPAIIRLKDFIPDPKIAFYTLNGASVDATNENRKIRVKISSGDFGIHPGANSFEFTFEPHSVTALEMRRRD